jgi:hypothetical protein
VGSHFGGARLRGLLIPAAMVLTAGILAGVALFTYLAYLRASTDLVVERDRQLTYLSAARLRDEVAKYAEVLTSFSRTPEISRGDVQARREALSRAQFRLAVFDGGVAVLDNFGKVQGAEPERPEILGQDWSGNDFFRETLISRDRYYSSAVRIGPDGVPVVVVAVPLLGDNDEFLGVLAGMFRLGESTVSAFYASLVRLRIGQTGDTLLVDGNGQVLYDSGYALVGQTWDVARFPGFGPQGGAARLQDADGNDVIAAYATVPGTQWTLVTEDDWSSATRPFRRYGNALLVLLALALILPLGGTILLLRKQEADLADRQSKAEEARVSRAIRHRLQPKQVPMMPGWSLAAHYQPASEAGGDFHDFMLLPDGQLMLVVGDVAGAGLSGAQVMATARTSFRGAAQRMLAPAEALEYGNELLYPEAADDMSVACMVVVLEPESGRARYANAGFVPPLHRENGGTTQLHAPGPPLAVHLNARYEEWNVNIGEGEYLFLFSDGLANARDPQGKMFGVDRLRALLAQRDGDAQAVVAAVLTELREFTGKRWTPQDDLTMLVVERNRDGSIKSDGA